MFVYKLDSHFQKIRLKIPAAIVLKIKKMGNILKYPDNVTEKCLQILTEMWKLKTVTWSRQTKKDSKYIFYPRIKVFLNEIYGTDTDTDTALCHVHCTISWVSFFLALSEI